VKKFNQTYDLLNREQCHTLMDMTGDTHEAIQQLEAGLEGTPDQRAEATFLFLELIGYLPMFIEHKGKTMPVVAKGLRAVMDKFYFVDFELDNGDVSTFPLLGPLSCAAVTMVDVENLKLIIKHAFPKVVIQTTTGTSKSGQTVYHTTVRPDFIQHNGAKGFPVESGSAECSNESVALMQATVRMIAAHLVGAYGAAVAVEYAKLATRPKNKTLADIGKEKYGDRNWTDLVSKIMQPNPLLDVLLKGQTDPKINGVYSAKASDFATQTANAEAKMKSQTDELVNSLEAIFGKGSVKVVHI
jgi:hypothetical protein